MKRNYLLAVLSLLLSVSCGFSQDLDRKAIVAQAIENNKQLKLQKFEIESTKLDKEKALLTYVPKIGVDGAYLYNGNDLTIERDVSHLQNNDAASLLNPESLQQSFESGYSNGFGQTWQQYLSNNPQLVQQLGGVDNAMLMGEGIASSVGQGISSGLQNTLSPFMGMGDQLTLPLIAGNHGAWFYDLHADMVIFSGLKVPNLSKAAQHKMMAQTAMYEKEEQEVIIETLAYFDRISVVDQSLEVLNEAKRRLKKQKEYVLKAKENGLATSYDYNKIKIAEQEIKSKEIELMAGKSLLISKLSQLTGIERSELEKLHPELEPWFVELDEMNAMNRPEIRALNESILAMEYKHKSEELDFLPKAKAFAHLTQAGSDLTEVDPFWFVGVGVKWEIFDGMQRKKDIQKSSIEVESMKIKKEEAEELVALDYEKTFMEWQVASQLVTVEKEKLNNAHEAMILKSKEYRNGLVGVNDKLEADNDYQKAQLDHIQSIYRQRQATAYLLKATALLNKDMIQ